MTAIVKSFSHVVLDITAGIALHLLVLRHGEWDFVLPVMIVKLIGICVPIVAIGALLFHNRIDIFWAWLSTISLRVFRVTGSLCVSILIYRWQFHRLRRFPGPLGSRLSTAYIMWKSGTSSNAFEMVADYHEQYGDFVRVGPAELSIKHPDAIAAIHSSKSSCIKSPWYDILQPHRSVFGARDRGEHQRRRRVWDHAFRPAALKEYEPSMRACVNQLVEKVSKNAALGTPVNMTEWFGCLMFDIIGELAFGESFGTLANGKPHYMMQYLHDSNVSTGIMIRAVWIIMVFRTIPIINRGLQQFLDFSETAMEKRLKRTDQPRDVFAWLWNDFSAKSPQTIQARQNLIADASLSVFAGSDTVAITMTGILYYLMRYPDYQKRLQDEFDEARERNNGSDVQDLTNLPLFNGIINESLRLHYAGPSGFPRITPPEGIRVGETFIPGNVNVKVPFYAVFRDERNFKHPDEFIPERWYSRRDLIHHPEVFVPFLMGAYNCVGKNAALMQIRWTMYSLFSRFEAQPSNKDQLQQYWDQRADGFSMGIGPLWTIFKERPARGSSTSH
ncbi:Cytochrome P450 [Penicillium concentricum]|uniref:Cytochrome P450 n=1 Tax=Penicillium concentricum TaxID=293559 RepID=A0A9W9SQ31_9EURO|nr:Cytochrome P450 [Penicillium concentricum]KAJ5382506.1 Cytochrome P450 [Penicillium concentricum]